MFVKSIETGMLAANCHIVVDAETGVGAVIDPGDYSSALKNEIISAGVTELKYILCTHGHFDHVSGVSRLKEEFPDSIVAVGEADKDALSNPTSGLSKYFRVDFYPCEADITLSEGDALTIGNIILKVIDAPGHTPGGVLYYCEEEGVMFTGDTVFRGSVGRTDLRGGDFSLLSETLEKIKAYPENTRLYCGHGENSDIGFEIKYNPYLK